MKGWLIDVEKTQDIKMCILESYVYTLYLYMICSNFHFIVIMNLYVINILSLSSREC